MRGERSWLWNSVAVAPGAQAGGGGMKSGSGRGRGGFLLSAAARGSSARGLRGASCGESAGSTGPLSQGAGGDGDHPPGVGAGLGKGRQEARLRVPLLSPHLRDRNPAEGTRALRREPALGLVSQRAPLEERALPQTARPFRPLPVTTWSGDTWPAGDRHQDTGAREG